MYTREWLVTRTRFYQSFGFFADYADLSDEELADQIIRLRQVETEREIAKLFHEGHDWLLLKLDAKRVLSTATDILYAEEPPDYNFDTFVETIQQLGSISRGAFIPQNIREAEPSVIEFVLNGQSFSFVPEGPPDDPLILVSQINPMIVETGYQFKQWDLSPDVFIFAMTVEEVERLGWRFLPDRWMFNE
ncbi:MAG: hypothetical protein KME13_09135 [Myxacorys californica WJT36-NPBG1]|jgi:hypothetical protein|nr:hypothetical protein [Myxacorys californica WJT36-NPBG1]